MAKRVWVAQGARTCRVGVHRRLGGGRKSPGSRSDAHPPGVAPPNSCQRSGPAPTSSGARGMRSRQPDSFRRFRCRMALPPSASPARLAATRSAGLQKSRAEVAVARVEVVSCRARPGTREGRRDTPGAVQAGHPNGRAFPRRPGHRSRRSSRYAEAANPTAPAMRGTHTDSLPTNRRRADVRPPAFQAMLVTRHQLQGRSDLLRHAARKRDRLRKTLLRTAARRQRQRTAASAKAFRQPARCRRPRPNASRTRPRCDERRARSPATPASV